MKKYRCLAKARKELELTPQSRLLKNEQCYFGLSEAVERENGVFK